MGRRGCVDGLWIIIVVSLAGVCGCCAPRRVYVPMETVNVSSARDSIEYWMRLLVMSSQVEKERETVRNERVKQERVVVNEQGDTLRHDTYETETTDRILELKRENSVLQAQVDSLRRANVRCDTVERAVPYPVKERVEVERELRWWEKALMWLGALCGCGLLLFFIIKKRVW